MELKKRRWLLSKVQRSLAAGGEKKRGFISFNSDKSREEGLLNLLLRPWMQIY
jgi:hypothetical protein